MSYLLLAAALAQTFNLNCAGTAQTGAIAKATASRVANIEKAEPFARIYRIDLTQNAWCEDECSDVHSFAEVNANQLVFSDTDEMTENIGRVSYSALVDHRTGVFRSLESSEQLDAGMIVTIKSVGACNLAPFTGFPATETKS